MECSRVQNLLSAYCDRELTGAEMLRVQRHLHGCPDCRHEHAAIVQVKELLSAAAAPKPLHPFRPESLARAGTSSPLPAPVSRALRAARSELTLRLSDAWAYLNRPASPGLYPPAAVCGAVAVAALLVALLQQPQSADAVTARVPEVVISDPAQYGDPAVLRVVAGPRPGAGVLTYYPRSGTREVLRGAYYEAPASQRPPLPGSNIQPTSWTTGVSP